METNDSKHFIIGITGASGSLLAKHAIKYLASTNMTLSIVATRQGEDVFRYETGIGLKEFVKELCTKNIKLYEYDEMFAPIASGSVHADGMFILPCSVGTIGKLAGGISDNLLTRAADVCIKERRKLVVAVRETPLSLIHLKNMTVLAEAGAIIVPPVVSFYNYPKSIDELVDGIVGRVLACGEIDNNLYKRWRS